MYKIIVYLVQGMKDRSNLTGQPELGLKNAITHRDNVDDYGHLIFEALQKVRTNFKPFKLKQVAHIKAVFQVVRMCYRGTEVASLNPMH